MHEFSLAASMLDIIMKQVTLHEAQKVEQVNLRIGRLSGVVGEALKFAFESLAMDTPVRGAKLAIEDVPVSCYCTACAREFTVADFQYRCPACRALSSDVRHGREMDLVSIAVT